eukprot:1263976-Rhodomonas_salina.2
MPGARRPAPQQEFNPLDPFGAFASVRPAVMLCCERGELTLCCCDVDVVWMSEVAFALVVCMGQVSLVAVPPAESSRPSKFGACARGRADCREWVCVAHDVAGDAGDQHGAAWQLMLTIEQHRTEAPTPPNEDCTLPSERDLVTRLTIRLS